MANLLRYKGIRSTPTCLLRRISSMFINSESHDEADGVLVFGVGGRVDCGMMKVHRRGLDVAVPGSVSFGVLMWENVMCLLS